MTYTLYKHTFPNGKVYIGMTSLPVNIRWANGKGYKDQILMKQAIDKYGWKNIIHDVLFTINNKELAEKFERLYITEIYHSNEREYGYNIQLGGLNKGFRPDYLNKQVGRALQGEKNPSYGKHWWTNGIDSVFSVEPPDSTWKRGASYFKGKTRVSSTKGKHCWTNGVNNKYSVECPGEGWVRGCAKLSEEANRQKQEMRKKTMIEKYGFEHVNYIPHIREQHRKALLGNKLVQDLHWYNNGKIQTLAKECPENFVPGMLKKKAKSSSK